MKKKIWISTIVVATLLILVSIFLANGLKENYEEGFVSVKNEQEFKAIMNMNGGRIDLSNDSIKNVFFNMLLTPWNIITNEYYGDRYSYATNRMYDRIYMLDEESLDSGVVETKSSAPLEVLNGAGQKTDNAVIEEAPTEKEFSTTNVQIENVDEADTVKTDGKYLYSISEDYVCITEAEKLELKVKIQEQNLIPEDMIIYNDKLVVINASNFNDVNAATVICTYDVTDKANPILKAKAEIDGNYYTSRRIENDVFVITNTYIYDTYEPIIYFNGEKKELGYDIIKYQRSNLMKRNNDLTYITTFNLTDLEKMPEINGYVMSLKEAFVSENNVYIMSQEYEYAHRNNPSIKSIFGPFGVFGAFIEANRINTIGSTSGYKTIIKKFNIKNGKIKYDCKGSIEGTTLNQFSFDEYDSNLRIAVSVNNTNGVVILDKNLKEIGKLTDLARGERIYSSRFIGNRLYLVTYKTTDPLFVIDLSNPKEPKVLGELKISGYSSYLHPYDENHLIGIGRETEEVINKDEFGRVINTWAVNRGLKMALFDVSNVNEPKQISTVTIGDSATYSNILTNHKALLFSKAKNLIAIPVNGYDLESGISNSNYSKSGFAVYDISIENGIKKKGTILHEGFDEDNKYYWYTNKENVRGLYIGDVLYTISDKQIFANKIQNLELIKKIKLVSNEKEE